MSEADPASASVHLARRAAHLKVKPLLLLRRCALAHIILNDPKILGLGMGLGNGVRLLPTLLVGD
jgi:hypothetical protein